MNHSFECKKTKQIINIKDCNNCRKKEYKTIFPTLGKSKPTIKKSPKLAKLERSRYSVFTTDLEHCIICGAKKDHIHEIYFGSYRQRSIKLGMCIPLCFSCHKEMHRNHEWQEYWHIKGQQYFEKNIGSKAEFIKIFGKSYIK